MIRLPLPPAASMMLVVGAAILSIFGSVSYLSGAVSAAADGASRSASSAGPNFIANLEPLPSGSISAVVPLASPPSSPAQPAAAAVTETAPAPAAEPASVVATTTPKAVATPVAPARDRMIVTSGVNVRDRPSSKSNVLGTFRAGTLVAVLDTNRGWIQVSDGTQTGWVYERFLRPSN